MCKRLKNSHVHFSYNAIHTYTGRQFIFGTFYYISVLEFLFVYLFWIVKHDRFWLSAAMGKSLLIVFCLYFLISFYVSCLVNKMCKLFDRINIDGNLSGFK